MYSNWEIIFIYHVKVQLNWNTCMIPALEMDQMKNTEPICKNFHLFQLLTCDYPTSSRILVLNTEKK